MMHATQKEGNLMLKNNDLLTKLFNICPEKGNIARVPPEEITTAYTIYSTKDRHGCVYTLL